MSYLIQPMSVFFIKSKKDNNQLEKRNKEFTTKFEEEPEKLPCGSFGVLSINIYLCAKMPFAYDPYISDRLYGSRKTTLGKALARELHIPFIDLDWYIEERFHKTVGELFSERGEASFRELEKNMLHEVGEFEDVVISTGGGGALLFDNMEYMNRVGTTVFLDVDPKVLFSRLRVAKQQRPILQGKKDDELLDFIVQALENARLLSSG